MLCHPLPATCQLLSQRSAMSKKVTFLAVSATLLSVVAAGVAGMAWYPLYNTLRVGLVTDVTLLAVKPQTGI